MPTLLTPPAVCQVAHNVVHLLMDFLSGDGALPVIEFVREIVEVR